jgi:sulfatase maturation enzyme AslB (radical SAM superfamily)
MSNDCKNSICSLPWMHLFISELGDIYPCCIVPESHTPNIDATGKKIRPDQVDNISEIFNTPYMAEIRSQMLRGERPKACTRCYKMEDTGQSSHRVASNELFPEVFNELLLNPTAADGHIEPQLLSIDMRLGNDCNLKCRMCSPFSSQSLIKEFIELEPHKESLYQSLRHVDWYKSDRFIKLIKTSKDLVKLHLAGGEPLITKEHKSLLHKLIESGAAKQVHLTYNTNLTVMPDEILTLWKEFKEVSVMVSLDGVGSVNDYIRYPSKWEVVKNNMQRLEGARQHVNFRYLSVNATVQIYNIYDLPNLCMFLNDDLEIFDLPVFSPLYYPSELSVQVLPANIKKLASAELTRFLESAAKRLTRFSPDSLTRMKNGISGIVHFMNENDRSELLPTFWRKTNFFDQSRSQNFSAFYDEHFRQR